MTRKEILEEQLPQLCTYQLVDIIMRIDKGDDKDDVLNEHIPHLLQDIQKSLFESALKFQTENTHDVQTYDEFKNLMEAQRGFIRTFWCGESVCERKIKEETMATIRIVLREDPHEKHDKKEGPCVSCGKESSKKVLFAKAY